MTDFFLAALQGIWTTLLEMAPYLLFGFLMAGVLSVLISAQTVERHLGTGRIMPVLKAALFGVPLPLCSCSVIPVAASLREHGANKGATTSFLISTPQTGVDSVFATYSLLGLTFAVYRPIVAFLSGVLGGLVVSHVDGAEEAAPAPAEPEGHGCCCCHHKQAPVLTRILRHGFITLPRGIATPLLVGLVIAGVIGAMVPHDFFAQGAGSGFGAKVVMMLVGIPVYVCATATIPVAAALIGAGISPGAALVFLTAGPATNAATITTIWKVMGKRTALVYLAVVAVSALLAGVLLDRVYTFTGTVAAPAGHEMLPAAFRIATAILLVGVLLYAKLGGRLARSAAA